MNIRVIDPFTIKPLDASTIVASARATGGKVITVEDHYKEGELLSEKPSRSDGTTRFPVPAPYAVRYFMLVPMLSL